MAKLMMEFSLKVGIVPCGFVFMLQLIQRGHQGFCDEHAAVGAKVAFSVREMGIQGWHGLGHVFGHVFSVTGKP
jgi:hypothetical protein